MESFFADIMRPSPRSCAVVRPSISLPATRPFSIGRLAVADGEVVGFSVNVLHEGTWTAAPVCYLEDLFVAPTFRRRGIDRLLIEDLVALAGARGWSRLYWHTRADNPARRLYDTFATTDDFVRYRLMFPEPD